MGICYPTFHASFVSIRSTRAKRMLVLSVLKCEIPKDLDWPSIVASTRPIARWRTAMGTIAMTARVLRIERHDKYAKYLGQTESEKQVARTHERWHMERTKYWNGTEDKDFWWLVEKSCNLRGVTFALWTALCGYVSRSNVCGVLAIEIVTIKRPTLQTRKYDICIL